MQNNNSKEGLLFNLDTLFGSIQNEEPSGNSDRQKRVSNAKKDNSNSDKEDAIPKFEAKKIVREKSSIEDAKVCATEYFHGDKLAGDVWVNKYALKDSDGNIYEKSPEEMHRRMSMEIARIENKYPNPMDEEEIFSLFDR